MTLSLDYQGFEDEPPESFLERAEEILTDVGVTFQSIICSDEDTVVLEKAGIGYYPAVLVYDQEGNVHRFPGEGVYEEVFPLVERLLASTP